MTRNYEQHWWLTEVTPDDGFKFLLIQLLTHCCLTAISASNHSAYRFKSNRGNSVKEENIKSEYTTRMQRVKQWNEVECKQSES